MSTRIEVNRENLIFSPLWFHERNLMQTASGYGRNLKSRYKIRVGKRVYRIYNCCFSNSGTTYIKTKDGEIIVDIS